MDRRDTNRLRELPVEPPQALLRGQMLGRNWQSCAGSCGYMREESFADVVNILERSVFNVKDTVHNELVERGPVYLSPRFDLYLTAGHLWTKGAQRGVLRVVFL